ncbi:MAG: MoaD/ThiS family protein [Flavipsychrobacter sp.]
MEVTILAFGIAKDIFGGSEISIDIEGEGSVKKLKATLEQQYPQLKELASYMVAVNDEYADDSLSITINDEIALIPPVSGG